MEINIINAEKSNRYIVGQELEAEIVHEEKNVDYAWYIYLEGNLIEKLWYKKNNKIIKYKFKKVGEYQIKAYIRRKDGSQESCFSKKIKVVKLKINSLIKKEIDIEELLQQDFDSSKPTMYTTIINGLKYDFILKRDFNSSDLVVMGSGASSLAPPRFNRFSWMYEIEGNVLYYNDPTLYLTDMRVGYGLGTPEIHPLKEIANIIKIVAKRIAVKNENILMFGSSAGGFMSMVLAGYIENSAAIVNNPVTIASNSNYFNKLVNILVENTKEFSGYNPEEIKDIFKNRLDIRSFYQGLSYLPRIYYLQNAACKYDIETRYSPFIEYVNTLTDKEYDTFVITQLYWDQVAQHDPVNKEETLKYIEQAKKILNN